MRFDEAIASSEINVFYAGKHADRKTDETDRTTDRQIDRQADGFKDRDGNGRDKTKQV